MQFLSSIRSAQWQHCSHSEALMKAITTTTTVTTKLDRGAHRHPCLVSLLPAMHSLDQPLGPPILFSNGLLFFYNLIRFY